MSFQGWEEPRSKELTFLRQTSGGCLLLSRQVMSDPATPWTAACQASLSLTVGVSRWSKWSVLWTGCSGQVWMPFLSSWPTFPICCLLRGACPMTNTLLGCPGLFCLPALSWVFTAICSGLWGPHITCGLDQALRVISVRSQWSARLSRS